MYAVCVQKMQTEVIGLMDEERVFQPVNNRTLINEKDASLLRYGYRIMQDTYEFVSYPSNSSIRIWNSATESDHYDTHHHSAVEVIMGVQGSVQIKVPQKEFAVMPGEILFIPSVMPHSLTMGENSERHLFLFEMDCLLSIRDFLLLNPMLASPIYLTASFSSIDSVRALLNRIIEEYHTDHPLKNMVMYTLLLEIYTILGDEYLLSSAEGTRLPLGKRKEYWELLQHVIEYVDQHYMEDITLDAIATEAGFSKYHFLRLFKKLTGDTFYHYLCQKRIAMAENLMRLSDFSISQIAMRTGFNSIATFNRIYKDIRGMTPSQYRSLYHSPHTLPSPGGAR